MVKKKKNEKSINSKCKMIGKSLHQDCCCVFVHRTWLSVRSKISEIFQFTPKHTYEIMSQFKHMLRKALMNENNFAKANVLNMMNLTVPIKDCSFFNHPTYFQTKSEVFSSQTNQQPRFRNCLKSCFFPKLQVTHIYV